MRERVKRLGFRGYRGLTKAEPQNILRNDLKPPYRTSNNLTVKQLKKLSEAQDIEFTPRIKKRDLVHLLSEVTEAVPAVNKITTFTNSVTLLSYDLVDVDFLWDETESIIVNRIKERLGSGQRIRMSAEVKFTKLDGTVSVNRFWDTPGERGKVVLPPTNLRNELLEFS